MQHQPGLPCSIYFAGAPLVESDQRGIEDRSSTRFTVEVSADGVAQVEVFFFFLGGEIVLKGCFWGLKTGILSQRLLFRRPYPVVNGGVLLFSVSVWQGVMVFTLA